MRYKSGKDFGNVILNGKEIADVVECDDELGFAVVYVRDAAGRHVIEGDKAKTKLLTGTVQFVPMERNNGLKQTAA